MKRYTDTRCENKHRGDVNKIGGMLSCKVLLWESLGSIGPSGGPPAPGAGC